METNTIAYWMALGVLALGLNSEYHRGNFVALHRIGNRAGSALCRISSRAGQTLALARLMNADEGVREDQFAANEKAQFVRDEADLVRDQAMAEAQLVRERVRDQVRAQAYAIREQADLQRAQIQRIRWNAASQVRTSRNGDRRMVVVCPKTGTRISLDMNGDLADFPSQVEGNYTF